MLWICIMMLRRSLWYNLLLNIRNPCLGEGVLQKEEGATDVYVDSQIVYYSLSVIILNICSIFPRITLRANSSVEITYY